MIAKQLNWYKSHCIGTVLGMVLVCAMAETPILHAQQDSATVARLVEHLRGPSPVNRRAALAQLARFGTQATNATESVIVCLGDGNSDVKIEAASTLAYIQTDSIRSLRSLLPLLSESDEHLRYAAEWAIAHIARDMKTTYSPTESRELAALLTQAHELLEAKPHQPRNAIAIATARNLLKQHQTVAATVKPKAVTVPEVRIDSMELAKSTYLASDTLGRFQFVYRLRDSKAYPDSLRRIVMRLECESTDNVLLQYMLLLWGDSAQQVLAERVQQLSKNERPIPSDITLIKYFRPATPELVDCLLQLLDSEKQNVDLRVAYIESLSHARTGQAKIASHVASLISDSDMEVRIAAIDALGRLGSEAAKYQTPLMSAYSGADEEVQYAILDAILAIAPSSPDAANFLGSLLASVPTNDPIYVNIVAACGEYRELAAPTVGRLTEILAHQDADLRSASARSLGKIGTPALSACAALIERILANDEDIRVLNAAANAIKQIGPKAISQLEKSLSMQNESSREHVLRALAITGLNSEESLSDCLVILNSTDLDASIRAAAATALGSMHDTASERNISRRSSRVLDAPTIASRLLTHVAAPEDEIVRSASIIAAARLHPDSVKDSIREQLDDPSLLIRASAGYAMHACGESRLGFDTLMAMLEGSETDEVIEQSLKDFGPAIHGWLVEVACDTGADRNQRTACFELACDVPSPEWSRLLPLVEDFELGQEFTVCLEGYWYASVFEADSVATDNVTALLSVLESKSLSLVGRARITGLLAPDGLGAGHEDEGWEGLTLSKAFATETLSSASKQRSAMAAPEPAMAEMSAAEPEAQAAVPPPAPSKKAMAPSTSPSERIADAASPTQSDSAPKETKVFYGTNRGRIAKNSQVNRSIALLATMVGGTLFAFALSAVGLFKGKNKAFAGMAMAAILALGGVGSYHALELVVQEQKLSIVYGGEYRDELEYGTCTVSIPPNHQAGMLEARSLFKLQVRTDPNKHVVLTQVQQLAPAQFMTDLKAMQAEKGRHLLVFVHGYNVSFEDAARRTAQMAYDLKFPGAPVFYSWPSQANWYSYKTDQENIELSVQQIKKFLAELVQQSGAETINLVAHSMGNVGLTQAIKEMEAADRPLFNQVVLAAPDIDADVFKTRVAPYITTKARHFTLYTSQTDLALVASRYFNHGPRVGDSGEGVALYPGIDTIDATEVDSSLLGHSYYGSNVSVLNDIGALLDNEPIARRPYLRQVGEMQSSYWTFDPLRVSQMPSLPSSR